MKRSEAVDKIQKFLDAYFGVAITEGTYHYLSAKILDVAEDMGMRPPIWENFNPSQSERTFSRDSDWNYHGKDESGKRIYSLNCDYWEEE